MADTPAAGTKRPHEETCDGDEVFETPEAKKAKRDKNNRDIIMDWRCPDCTWINWACYKKVVCYNCEKPKPSDDELTRYHEIGLERRERRRTKRYPGGNAEAELREDMTNEIVLATQFLEKCQGRLETVGSQREKLQTRVCICCAPTPWPYSIPPHILCSYQQKEAVSDMLAINADLEKLIADTPDNLTEAKSKIDYFLSCVNAFP